MEVPSKVKPTQPEMWRVRVEKPLVEEVDELKWQFRTTRKNLIHRMLRLSLHLWNNVGEDGITQFERMEQAIDIIEEE